MDRIVSDGRRWLLKTPETKERISEIKERIKKKYSTQLAEVGWFRRIALKAKMRREIRKEIDRMAPKDALY